MAGAKPSGIFRIHELADCLFDAPYRPPNVIISDHQARMDWNGFVYRGLVAFFIGAVQIYWSKLKKREAIVKGVYRHIRHPQYLALMISGLGMVLIWPRYLVLFGFITLCFAYFLLARLEEKICLREFPEYDT